ncbi:MAG: beta-ketoacyl synthase N-terminal-like domain-containing protein [Asticcacaulis sp.]
MSDIFIAAGLRSPFARADGALAGYDAIQLSRAGRPGDDGAVAGRRAAGFRCLGLVVPNLGWSNIAREIWMDAGLDPTVPACSVVLACASSLTAAISAGGMLAEGVRDLVIVGGVESLSRVQIGLDQSLSVWLKHFLQARSVGAKLETVQELHWRDVRLHIPAIVNRTTGKSMGEHTEETAKEWHISREAPDAWALQGHQRVTAARARGFFDDLIVPVGEVGQDTIPRAGTSLEKLAKLPPVFDRISGPRHLDGRQFLAGDRWRGLMLGGDAHGSRPPAGSDAVRPADRL